MKDLTILFTKVNSISIHNLSPYKLYKRCPRTFLQVVEYNPPIKNKTSTRTFFSRHGLHSRLQAIKLFDSLNYPLKTSKGKLCHI
jgi:hypothetical protein